MTAALTGQAGFLGTGELGLCAPRVQCVVATSSCLLGTIQVFTTLLDGSTVFDQASLPSLGLAG